MGIDTFPFRSAFFLKKNLVGPCWHLENVSKRCWLNGICQSMQGYVSIRLRSVYLLICTETTRIAERMYLLLLLFLLLYYITHIKDYLTLFSNSFSLEVQIILFIRIIVTEFFNTTEFIEIYFLIII